MVNDPRQSALEALWQRVRENPADDEAHQKVLKYAQTADMMAPLLAKYKELDGAHPEVAARWKKTIAEAMIATAAMRMPAGDSLLSRKSGGGGDRRLSAVAGGFLVAGGLANVALFGATRPFLTLVLLFGGFAFLLHFFRRK